MLLKNTPARARRQSGFTMIELLVTMLIVTVGLLGLAKLQAAAVAESSMSRTRALMTFQAEALAGMMRANKAFWTTVNTTATYPTFSVSAAGVVASTVMTARASSTDYTCKDQTCTANQLAYDDMYTWAGTFNSGTAGTSAFPNSTATITCISSSGAASCAANPAVPNSYDIVLTWPEKFVAINRNTVNATPKTNTMVMHVQP